MLRSLRVVALPLLVLASLACNGLTPPAATSTAPPLATPRAATAPAPAAPTATEPSSTGTPVPPSGLNPAGPYVLFQSPSGLWLTNPDGSFPKQLTDRPGTGSLRGALSPTGDRLALVMPVDTGLDLVLVSLPDGATETIAHLSTLTLDAEISDPIGPAAFAAYAIRDFDSVAWQPGVGRLLAFVGAINGPTADIYVYDTDTKTISQLTDGPSQAVLPNWSPDGQYLLHAGVSWVGPFGGAILGPTQLDGVWSIRISDGVLIELPKPAGVNPNFVGWLDNNDYLTFDSDPDCDATNLRGVAVANGEAKPLFEGSFYYSIAQSSLNGALLMASNASVEGCPPSLGVGAWLMFPGQAVPLNLLDKVAYEVDWLPESQVFDAYPEALFSADGQTRYDPPVYDASFDPAISTAGDEAWQVIENQQGRVVVRSPGGDWQTILEGFVDQELWDPAGARTLLIALEDGSLYSAAYPDFAPRLLGNLGGRVDQAIWVP